ncbi:YciI-like protein [Trinickia sp. YCB016]
MHFLLMYEVSADYLERRGQYRAEHLELAWQAVERGELLLAGALADPVDGAVLLFEGESAEVAEAFVTRDPYVRNGLVTSWKVRQWTTVVGEDATTPVR